MKGSREFGGLRRRGAARKKERHLVRAFPVTGDKDMLQAVETKDVRAEERQSSFDHSVPGEQGLFVGDIGMLRDDRRLHETAGQHVSRLHRGVLRLGRDELEIVFPMNEAELVAGDIAVIADRGVDRLRTPLGTVDREGIGRIAHVEYEHLHPRVRCAAQRHSLAGQGHETGGQIEFGLAVDLVGEGRRREGFGRTHRPQSDRPGGEEVGNLGRRARRRRRLRGDGQGDIDGRIETRLLQEHPRQHARQHHHGADGNRLLHCAWAPAVGY